MKECTVNNRWEKKGRRNSGWDYLKQDHGRAKLLYNKGVGERNWGSAWAKFFSKNLDILKFNPLKYVFYGTFSTYFQ